MEKQTLLEELRVRAETWDSDYDLYKWIESKKEELNKIGLYLPKEE
jgi:hypothetical protein